MWIKRVAASVLFFPAVALAVGVFVPVASVYIPTQMVVKSRRKRRQRMLDLEWRRQQQFDVRALERQKVVFLYF